MPDYQQGKVYAIKSNKTNDIYIGSTADILEKRFNRHNNDFNQYKKGNSNFCCSYKLLEIYDDCYIELIELFPCNSRKELERREGEIQRQYKNIIVNKYIAGRTDNEYYRDNAEKNKEYKHQYRNDNKDTIKEYQKVYRIENADKIKQNQKKYYLKKKSEKELIKHLEIISLL